jgi:hypothetical protein
VFVVTGSPRSSFRCSSAQNRWTRPIVAKNASTPPTLSWRIMRRSSRCGGTWPFWMSRLSMSRITVCCIAVEFAIVEPTSTSSASASPSCSPKNV